MNLLIQSPGRRTKEEELTTANLQDPLSSEKPQLRTETTSNIVTNLNNYSARGKKWEEL
jgi:hypothetical protein